MSYRINKFKERLEYLNTWLVDTLNYEEYRSLSLRATLNVYEDQPLVSFLYKIYLLPTLIITYLSKLKSRYLIKKCIKEMALIRNTIEDQEQFSKKILHKYKIKKNEKN